MISRKNKLLAILLSAVLFIGTAFIGVTAAPKGVKITKITTTANGKSANVTFKKVKGAKKYQVRYGYKKNLKVAKTKTVKKTSVILKKLKAGKTLYVKVRAKLKKGYTKYGAVKKVKLSVAQAPITQAPVTVAPTVQATTTAKVTPTKATTTKAPTTIPTTTEAPDTEGQTVYDMSELYDSTRVLGRGVYGADNKTLVCDWVTSGYEVGADCEGDITVNFKVIGSAGMIGVVIDEDFKNKHVVKFTSGENSIALNTNLTKGYHKIRVVKLNECDGQTNSITFKSLGIIGTPDDKPAAKTLKFEVYGDSITAGHGNLSGRSISGTFGHYQDGLKTYISLLAQKVGADLNVVAQSGMGIEYGYSDGSNIIANYWDKATPKSNNSAKWDFTTYTPDIVFINLGTNDTSMFNGHPTTADSIKSTALTIIGNIRAKYPNCKIVWLEGMMGSYASQISTGIANAIAETSNAYHIKDLPVGNNGGNWHPNEAEHKAAYEVLYTKLKSLDLVE